MYRTCRHYSSQCCNNDSDDDDDVTVCFGGWLSSRRNDRHIRKGTKEVPNSATSHFRNITTSNHYPVRTKFLHTW
jgi:hypothetical protein